MLVYQLIQKLKLLGGEVTIIFIFQHILTRWVVPVQRTKQEHDLLGAGDQSEEGTEGVANAKWTSLKAALMLLVGAAIAAAFADPLVDAVDNFSSATSIPTFFISFIALPLATNSSEAVSAVIFATRKKKRTSSLTFSEVCFSCIYLCFRVFTSASM